MKTLPNFLQVAAICFVLLGGSPAIAAEKIDFDREIRPILSDNCFHCHGPDEADQKGDLRLDQPEGAIQSGVIVPGSPDKSELIYRITAHDDDEVMPPPKAKLGKLSKGEIELLSRWIEQGAEYQPHWAFQPLKTPAVPKTAAKDPNLPIRNAIDHFVRHKLDGKGISQQPEAQKERLLRRVTFDLTGLPPTPEEVRAFLADDSPDAYEKVVERLLASPRFGERLAVDWLDAARYADTYGFQVDRDRATWPWRDWVIRAFNENLPYDKFITYQVAGDLLPDATDDQILATAFNRLHQQKVEGGTVEEEFRVEYVADRTQTFGTAFLGLTLECSKCHDHKFDPISQKEFYQLFAYFDDIAESGLYSYFTSSTPTPTMLLTDEPTKKRIQDVENDIAAKEVKLAEVAGGQKEEFEKWLASGRTEKPGIADEIIHLTFDKREGGKFPNSATMAAGKYPATTSGANVEVEGKSGKAVQLTGDDAVNLGLGSYMRHQPFSIALWLKAPVKYDRAVVFHRSRAWTDAGSRGYQLLIEDGKLSWSLVHFWPGNAISIKTTNDVTPGDWTHVAVTYDGSSRADGLRIYVNGGLAQTDVVFDNLYKNITGGGGDKIAIGERFRDRGFKGGSVDEFRVVGREITPIEVMEMFDGQALTTLSSIAADKLTEAQKATLLPYYLSTTNAAYKAALAELQTSRHNRGKTVDGISEIMVMSELEQPRQAYILERGLYSARGEPVSAGTPGALPPFPEDAPKNRLGLANWLTQPDHPLTARVTVNRYWQNLFGRGLVTTPEDFGSQGARPTYPGLLDWLAADFVASGWDVKHVFRTIVLSHTYRQDSDGTRELYAEDPKNDLLARGPRHRLPAEMIRDGALAASGLLVEKIGGPPVNPYDVAESFKPKKHDRGQNLYRRSIYTYWKRTAPAPAMMAFNAVKRDVCSVAREANQSPLQALVLLNGPQFVEAARVLAESVLKGDPDKAANEIVAEIFFRLIGRQPSETESGILTSLFQDQLASFTKDPDSAKAYIGVGDRKPDASLPAPAVAAATSIAQTLMSFDECVTKR